METVPTLSNSLGKVRQITFLVSVLTLALSASGTSLPAVHAVNASSQRLVSGFEKEIKKRESAIAASKEKADKAKQLNRQDFANGLKTMEETYNKTLVDIQTNLQAKLDDSNKALDEAKAKWEQVNKIKLTTGFFGSDLSRINNVLECIAPYSDGSAPFPLVKRLCANNGGYPRPGDRIPANPLSTYGGADWQKDDVTSINFVNANDSYLSDGIKYGFVVPFNPTEFESTRQKISKSLADIDKYKTEIVSAKKNAEDVRIVKRIQLEEKWILADNAFDDEFEKDLALFSDETENLTFGLKAAKRAAKQSGSLKTSFDIALKFAYNVKKLDELASEPWSYIDSLKSLRNIVQVTDLSEEADRIDSRYSNGGAVKINRLCGNVFIKEAKFRSLYSISMLMFKKYAEGK